MLCKQQAHAEMGQVHNGPDSVILSKIPLTSVDIMSQVFQSLNFTPNEDRSTGRNQG